MSAKIIDGKQIAADIREELKTEVAALKEKGVVPGLGSGGLRRLCVLSCV